ncbi:MAG: Gfo/Idh/MocA family oxidoreductase, partial [Pseudomonadota bacterium]
MARKLRAGVAGAGVFGGYHARKYAESAQADLAAIFDIDIGRAMERAAEYGVRAHDDFAAFLSQVDVLTVATPATTHGTLAKEAVAAGKHVLVEKPIALELSAADAIVKAANEGGTVLQVGHQERYVAGAFGLLDRAAPQALRSRRLNKFSPRAGDVSVVMDLMIHDLDLLAELTGLYEITIVNVDQRREKSDFADFVDVTVKAGDT